MQCKYVCMYVCHIQGFPACLWRAVTRAWAWVCSVLRAVPVRWEDDIYIYIVLKAFSAVGNLL